MKRSLSLLTLGTLLSVSLTPAPSRAEQESKPVQVASLGQDDMGLYFDQAELTTVESATHAPKPITQVAENISIITAQDIERWNAHSLQDVLAHVPGVLVGYSGREVANNAIINIQGSSWWGETQIYLDGIRWNSMDADYNLTNQIPVEIIERVEVIKGPASSSWGSAMGGAINIITKGTGSNTIPSGTVTASYGERNTQGASTQLAGLAGPVGYFLHGGALSSDGLLYDRWLDRDTLYAKFSSPLPGQTTLTVTMGHFNIANTYVNFQDRNQGLQGGHWDEFNRFATATLTRPLGEHLHLLLYGSLLDKKYTDSRFTPPSHPISYQYTYDSETPGLGEHSGAIRLYGDLGRHSISLGAETYRNAYDEYFFEDRGQNTFSQETWAVYANDTIHLGQVALTPGLRYDNNSIAAPQVSPSLGLTYRLNDSTLFRALAARGFRRPVSDLKQANFWADYVNPDLESETVKTYQMGLENTAIPGLRLKATAFRHQVDHRWTFDNTRWIYVNNDGMNRNGIELEVETERWHGLALTANHTYVSFSPDSGDNPGETSYSNLIFDYEGPWGLNGRLSGNYTWLNDNAANPGFDGKFDTMTWDLTATKVVSYSDRYRFNLFATVNNLFNGSQYSDYASMNAGRWLEGGLRLHF